jgi:hypothetical protein
VLNFIFCARVAVELLVVGHGLNPVSPERAPLMDPWEKSRQMFFQTFQILRIYLMSRANIFDCWALLLLLLLQASP